jgi:hypothetical protein
MKSVAFNRSIAAMLAIDQLGVGAIWWANQYQLNGLAQSVFDDD